MKYNGVLKEQVQVGCFRDNITYNKRHHRRCVTNMMHLNELLGLKSSAAFWATVQTGFPQIGFPGQKVDENP